MSPALSHANMSTKAEEHTLASPRDWETWDRAFRAKAIASDLWSHIDPTSDGEPLLEKPKRPEISEYNKYQTPASQVTPTESSGTVGTQEPITTTENTTTSPSTASNIPARVFSDLSPQDRKEYQFRPSEHSIYSREYHQQQEKILSLQSWVTSTVAQNYLYTCCDSSESLRTWYSNLREQVKPKRRDGQEAILDEYEDAIRPLHKPPRDFHKWLTNWTTVTSRALKHDIPRTSKPWAWWRDFRKAISEVNPSWARMYHGFYQQYLDNDSLTIRQVAADFAQEISENATTRRTKVAKGAFGPTYHGEGADKKEKEDVRPIYKSRGKRKRFQPARAQSSQTRDEPERKCLVCERTTCPSLELCYYAFPDQAPKEWVPWAQVQEVADNNLEIPSIKKKVAEIAKNKRQKVTHTATSDDGKQ